MNSGNPMLRQVLGGVLGQALGRRGLGGGLAGGLGGMALGSMLAGALRNRGTPQGTPGGGHPYANPTALMVMLLPLAMRWVQNNGGVGSVLDRFKQQGFGRQAQSWVASSDNQPIDEGAVTQVVGASELQQMAQRLGVPQEQVAQAFAEIMPQMVDHLSPQGELPKQADEVLDEGRRDLEKEIQDVQFRDVHPS